MGAVESGFGQLIEQAVGLAVEHSVPLLDSGLADGLLSSSFEPRPPLATRFVVERFSGLKLGLGLRGSRITGMAGFAAPESVITSLAGFGAPRPQPLGERTAIPAAFR
jgi:hypothetical protein